MTTRPAEMTLVDHHGRKYLTADERQRFFAAVRTHRRPTVQTLASTLALTGCRISEALGLRACDVDLTAAELRIRTLKGKHQNPWGQSSGHRRLNVQTSTSNARSPGPSMSMSQRSIAVSTTRRPYDSTPFRSHARSIPHFLVPPKIWRLGVISLVRPWQSKAIHTHACASIDLPASDRFAIERKQPLKFRNLLIINIVFSEMPTP